MSYFADIQTELADALLADPWFSNIPVFTEDLGDIENKIQIALGSLGTGTCVVLVTPLVDCQWKNTQLYFNKVMVVARVIMNRLVNYGPNGTQKAAGDTALTIAKLMHFYRPSNEIFESVVVDSPAVKLAPDPTPGRVSYDVRLLTMGGTGYTVPVVADPIAVNTGGNVISISCSTPGAGIWYTTDGVTYPSPRLGTLYTGTFNVTSPSTIKCRAWLAGYRTSKLITLTV